MYIVEVRRGGDDVAGPMNQMRTWLDAKRIEPVVFQLSIIPGGRETGEALVRHPGVDKISFTGSSATGRHIASLCGEQLSG